MITSNPQISVTLNSKDVFLICVHVHHGFVVQVVLTCEDRLRRASSSEMLLIGGARERKMKNSVGALKRFYPEVTHIIFYSYFIGRTSTIAIPNFKVMRCTSLSYNLKWRRTRYWWIVTPSTVTEFSFNPGLWFTYGQNRWARASYLILNQFFITWPYWYIWRKFSQFKYPICVTIQI